MCTFCFLLFRFIVLHFVCEIKISIFIPLIIPAKTAKA